MKTTTTVMLGLMAALVVLAPTAASDEVEEQTAAQCLPVWVDSQGNPHVDPSCVPSHVETVHG